MKKLFLPILILSISLVSCNKQDKIDHSLSLEEYQERGIPDYDMVWNMENYSTAFFVLNTIKYENPKALPVRESEKSGMLFSRMISIENLSFLQDEELPLWAKADMIKWFVNTLMELKVVYQTIGTEQQYYVKELIDIDIFRVSVAHKMLELGQQINESEDPSDVAMQSDFPHIRHMYLDILRELFVLQQNESLIPEETLELLSDSLSASVKQNMHWFDERASESIRQAMRAVIDVSTSSQIKNSYSELAEML